MDSENRVIIINQLKNLIPFLTEELLLSLSNKGTVNRGKKDLEKRKDEIHIGMNEKGEVVVIIPEEADVILRDNLSSCSCSCPSLTMCRHQITAFLYAEEFYKLYQEEQGSSAEELVEESSMEDFKELNKLTFDDVKKLIGKKEYISYIKSITKQNDAVFLYKDMLKVFLTNQNITVFFPPKDSISNALCSCKDSTICGHKAYAVLAYLMMERKMEVPIEEEIRVITAEDQEFLLQMKKKMESYMEKGLASLTDEVIWQMEQDYIRAYGMKFFHFADDIKQLASDFTMYFTKNVSFENIRTMHLICRIYNRVEAILCMKDAKNHAVLIGNRKEESQEYDKLNLLGLGVVLRLTKRNDIYVSAYFYCQELKKIFSVSTLRSVVENHQLASNVSYLLSSGILWEEERSFKQIFCSKVVLSSAVVRAGRISGTKASKSVLDGTISGEDLEQTTLVDIAQLRGEIRKKTYQYFASYAERENIYLLKVYDMGSFYYDKIKQAFMMPIYDHTGEEVLLYIKYNKVTERAIRFLEKNDKLKFDYVLADFVEKKGRIRGSFLGGFVSGEPCEVFF